MITRHCFRTGFDLRRHHFTFIDVFTFICIQKLGAEGISGKRYTLNFQPVRGRVSVRGQDGKLAPSPHREKHLNRGNTAILNIIDIEFVLD
jgi:hypothetical protein